MALFGELYWSHGAVLQAEDRIHRLGQLADEVRIIYLIARNTADEIVWEQIQKKHQVVGATVGKGVLSVMYVMYDRFYALWVF